MVEPLALGQNNIPYDTWENGQCTTVAKSFHHLDEYSMIVLHIIGRAYAYAELPLTNGEWESFKHGHPP